MTIFEHPIWPYIRPFAQVSDGRANVDFLQLPAQLRSLALDAVCNCVSCGKVIHPLRARAKSERSRIAGTPTEWRLFYAPTCETEKDAGCSRTKSAKSHKDETIKMLSGSSNIYADAIEAVNTNEPSSCARTAVEDAACESQAVSCNSAQQGEALLQIALTEVREGADPTWLNRVTAVVKSLARERSHFTTDDIWKKVPTTREPRAMGAVMRDAVAAGLIVGTSQFIKSERPECHRRPLQVWASASLGMQASDNSIETYDALCLQEPYLELILLGIKTLETRTKMLRKNGGEIVLTSSLSYNETAMNDPSAGGLLDAAAKKRALDGLGTFAGIVMFDDARPGVPGVDDRAACIGIGLPDGKVRVVNAISNVRRVERAPTMRVRRRPGEPDRVVSGSSQGIFKVPRVQVKVCQ